MTPGRRFDLAMVGVGVLGAAGGIGVVLYFVVHDWYLVDRWFVPVALGCMLACVCAVMALGRPR